MAGKPGVTYQSPPIHRLEFVYVQKSGKPPGLPQGSNSNTTSVAVQSTPGVNSLPRSISPAPKPWPPFEHFLSFADIAPNNTKTHKVIEDVGIVGFDEFLFAENGMEVLEKAGMKHGPAARLIRRAAEYCQQLKQDRVAHEIFGAANH